MVQHNINGVSDNFQQRKDSHIQGINPVFDIDKYISVDDIKADVFQHIQQGNEAAAVIENRFPVEVFPPLFQDLINECKKSLNFPTDYTGTAILSAVSTTIGKSAKVKVKAGWYELAALYIAIVGNAGANKSHPMDMAFKPIQSIDKVLIDQFSIKNDEYEAFQKDKKDRKDKGQIEISKPKLEKTILHNFTPEILCQRLTDNLRGCIALSDELATFLEGINNYSKGDQSSVYLSLWSNKPTSIDRVSKPVPLWLPQPFLNIIGSLQPRVLPKLFPSGKTDNGFLQRFLFAFPACAEKQPINDYEIDESLLIEYSKWIEQYIFLTPIEIDPDTEKPNPRIYYWSLEAKAFFYQWQKQNTASVNDNAESLKGEILSKFDIHFVRLSLILQVMEDYSTYQISLKAVQGAAKLCTYFLNNAIKVLDILEASSPSNVLPQNKLLLYDALPNKFTTAEANSIGEGFKFNVKAVQRLLSDTNLFTKTAQGQYSKSSK